MTSTYPARARPDAGWQAPNVSSRADSGQPVHAARSGRLAGPIAVTAALGLMLVAAAFTASRMGHASASWPDRCYWLGQAMIVGPAALALVSRRLTEAGTVAILLTVTVAEYLAKVCYSPLLFSYPDEMEHWRSTVNLLHSGRLFGVNYVLPISPHYPGLEEVTASLASITGLSVYDAGLIVASAAHVLFIGLLYLIFRRMSGSWWIAGLAALIYCSNPNLTEFDSMFAYQTLAVAFLAVTVLAAWHVTAGRERRAGWMAVAVIGLLATVITHHVTSYVLAATLALVAVACACARQRSAAVRAAVLAAVATGAVVCWLRLAAPQTMSYLMPEAQSLLANVRGLLDGGHSAAPSASAGPPGDVLLSGLTVLVLSAILPVGFWYVWRRFRSNPWTVAMAVGAACWYGVVVVRLVAADGSELAGRASTFVFIPLGYIAALAVAQFGRPGRSRRWLISGLLPAIVVLVLLNGMANGWPPYWERLPGPYQVAGFERSVEPAEIDTAQWALRTLGPGNRFAADFGSYTVLGSYGDQNPVLNDAFLYTSPRFSKAAAQQVQAAAIRYVLVDLRMARELPASGQYFPGLDPGAGHYTHPLSIAGLVKFSRIRGVSRIYDSGDIVIYDLWGSRYYAP